MRADGEAAPAPALAQAGVDQRRLEARIGADQQAEVGLLDAGDRGVEEVAAARALASSLAPSWRQSRCGEPSASIRSLSTTMASQSTRSPTIAADPLAGHARRGGPGSRRTRRASSVGAQLAVLPDHRHVQAALLQAVVGKAGLVGDPLLVDVLVQARHDPHDLGRARVDRGCCSRPHRARRSIRSCAAPTGARGTRRAWS